MTRWSFFPQGEIDGVRPPDPVKRAEDIEKGDLPKVVNRCGYNRVVKRVQYLRRCNQSLYYPDMKQSVFGAHSYFGSICWDCSAPKIREAILLRWPTFDPDTMKPYEPQVPARERAQRRVAVEHAISSTSGPVGKAQHRVGLKRVDEEWI